MEELVCFGQEALDLDLSVTKLGTRSHLLNEQELPLCDTITRSGNAGVSHGTDKFRERGILYDLEHVRNGGVDEAPQGISDIPLVGVVNGPKLQTGSDWNRVLHITIQLSDLYLGAGDRVYRSVFLTS